MSNNGNEDGDVDETEVDDEDFLSASLFNMALHGEDASDVGREEPSDVASDDIIYKHKKPKWWVQRSGRASKAQRKAMREMESHKLMKPPYGELIDWSSVFPQGVQDDNNNKCGEPLDVWLEVGFGGGENLLRLAEQYQGKRYFIGVEIHAGGIGKAFRRIQEAIEKKRFWTDYNLYSADVHSAGANSMDDRSKSDEGVVVENPYCNVRLHRGDGVKLLAYFPRGSLSAILITNPDPFAKKGEEELRLIQTGTIRQLRRCLRSRGHLYLATDHEGYFEWSLQIVDRVNERDDERIFRRIEPCPPRQEWLPVVSNYEQKGWDAGRSTFLACWEAIP